MDDELNLDTMDSAVEEKTAPPPEEKSPPKKEGDENSKDATEKPASNMKLIIILCSAFFVLLSGAGAGLYFYFKSAADAKIKLAEEKLKSTLSPKPKKVEKVYVPKFYYVISPTFLVNFEDKKKKPHYLQTDIAVMVLSEDDKWKIQDNRAMLKDVFVSKISSYDINVLKTREGKLKLRKELKEVARKTLNDEFGKPIVEEVFYNSYVTQ